MGSGGIGGILGSVGGKILGDMVMPGIGGQIGGMIGGSLLGGGGGGSGGKGLGVKSLFTPYYAGGISAGYNKGAINVVGDKTRQNLVNSLADSYVKQAGTIEGSIAPAFRSAFGGYLTDLADVRNRIAPGFGELTTARLGAIEDARQKAVGDIRDQMNRRRLLGSSFAFDTASRAESEFAKQAAEAAATSKLQELDLTAQVIDKQYQTNIANVQNILDLTGLQADLRRQGKTTKLDEMNKLAAMAQELSTSMQSSLGANARTAYEIAAKQAGEQGALGANILDKIGNQGIGGLLGGLFGGGSKTA